MSCASRASSPISWTIARAPRLAERSIVRTHDGLSIALARHAGDGPPLLAVHATGFCKEVWDPVVAGGLGGCDVVAPDQRGHGESEEPSPTIDWWDLGRDLLTIVDGLGLDGPFGTGHSSGGSALVMAEILRPGTFRGLVLFEPILLPGPARRVEDHPLALRAEQRRPGFASHDEARDSYRSRPPFDRWDEDVFAGYLRGGLRDAANGGVELRCRPAFEAECYRTGLFTGAWDRLSEVRCPTLLVAGSESDTHVPDLIEAQAGALEDATVEIVDGASHFLPMERPVAAAGIVAGLIDRVCGASLDRR